MELVYNFFTANIIIVYFVYGLVFFLMGFAIALKNDKPSLLRISQSFNYLAAFGIIHGLSEWGHVFIPLMESYSSELTLAALYFIEISLIGFSFVFLLYFGLKLFVDTLSLSRHILWVPRIAAILWFGIFILYPNLTDRGDIPHWYLLGDIFSRYLFALPGATLSAVAFWKQQDDLAALGQPQVLRHLRSTSVMFLLYALFAGLIVPRAPFLPASVLNIQNLFRLTGLPVAVYRAGICSVIAYLVIRLTAIFNYEDRKTMAETQQEYAILKERQRIRRDLHDGILQSIYAVGLNLESARQLTATDPQKADETIARENIRLDEINREIRNYIMDIQQTSYGEKQLKEIILGMVEEFKQNCNLPVELIIMNSHRECLHHEQKRHLHLIVQELLSNIKKHSKARKATLSLKFYAQYLELIVADDGIGFPPETQRSGLQNVLERAEQLAADIDISSEQGQGTRITLKVSCDCKDC
jgi:signal transduction histidine kinase